MTVGVSSSSSSSGTESVTTYVFSIIEDVLVIIEVFTPASHVRTSTSLPLETSLIASTHFTLLTSSSAARINISGRPYRRECISKPYGFPLLSDSTTVQLSRLMDPLNTRVLLKKMHALLLTITHSLNQSINHSLTHSLTHSITHSLNHSLTHSLIHLIISLAHTLPSLHHSLTHNIPHPSLSPTS